MIQWSAHISLVLTSLPFLDRFEAASRLGFRCVEWWWVPDGQRQEAIEEVRRLGLQVASVNSPPGDLDAGERGFAHDPARLDEFISGVTDAVTLAAAVRAPCVNVQVGRDDGVRSRSSQLEQVEHALRLASEVAATKGVTLLVENINGLDVPGYLVPDPGAAAEMVLRVDAPALRLLYDAYHAGKLGRDVAADVRRFAPLIAHTQYAQWPDRSPPDTAGRALLAAFAEALAAEDFSGAIGLEFGDPDGHRAAEIVSQPPIEPRDARGRG